MAKKLRREMTGAEKVLWEILRRKSFGGYKFRRQFPLTHDSSNFVADFYCSAKRLVIEVDGEIHNYQDFKERDKLREDILIRNDYKVLRINNEDVFNKIDDVIKKIKIMLE